jgi:hypothetical protein
LATDWPLILAGPIVRRVEPRLAAIWLALRAPCTVRLAVYDGFEPADTQQPPFVEATVHSLRAADFLHIALAVARIGESNAPFLPGHVYSYNLSLTDESDASSQHTLSSLGLLQDRAGVEQDDQLSVKPHLALGYQAGMLPSFVLPPTELLDLKLLHASCRRPHVATPDAMTFVDDLIDAGRTDPLQRPHQLFLTGDQIYADDVATSLLHWLMDIGNTLTGSFAVDGEATGGVEQLPTRWPNQPPGTQSVRLWPANHDYFPAGLRRNATVNEARFSTEDGESHLFSFGEFCAMHLLVWCNELWPARLPRIEDVLIAPTSFPPEKEIWSLHTGLGSGFKDEDALTLAPTDEFDVGLKQLCSPADRKTIGDTLTADNMAIVMRATCNHYRESFTTHRANIKKFRDGLPKVRRALANIPTYMIFDDHEITDDWYLSQIWRDQVLSSPLGRTVIRNGLLAYLLFQGWGNDPTQFEVNIPSPTGGTPEPGPHVQLLAAATQLFKHGDPAPPDGPTADAIDTLLGLDGKDPPVTWHYAVPGSRHQVQVLDCRTRRGYANRVAGPGNVSAQALVQQLPPGPLRAGIDVLLVVSSLTVLGPPVIDELLGPLLFHLFDLKHGNRVAQPGLDPDAIEAWPYDPVAFETLLKRLEPYRRVVLLSGDVHFATSAAMSYWKKDDQLPARFAQFISSGVMNLFQDQVRMAGQYLAFMQHVIAARIGVERLGYNETAPDLLLLPPDTHPAPALRDRLRTTPVLLPTEGWPSGTDENILRPPDWAWHTDIVRDERPDAARSPNIRPADLLPTSPGSDVAPDISGYRHSAVRHVKQLDKRLDNLIHSRQILFASNIGMVRFERTTDSGLTAVHELYALAEHASAAAGPEVMTQHRVLLEIAQSAPADQRLRPTIGTPRP